MREILDPKRSSLVDDKSKIEIGALFFRGGWGAGSYFLRMEEHHTIEDFMLNVSNKGSPMGDSNFTPLPSLLAEIELNTKDKSNQDI